MPVIPRHWPATPTPAVPREAGVRARVRGRAARQRREDAGHRLRRPVHEQLPADRHDLAGGRVHHRGPGVGPAEIDPQREPPGGHHAPSSRFSSSTLDRTSRSISTSRACVVASKRRTRIGWVLDARTSPQPSGKTTRTPSTVTAS